MHNYATLFCEAGGRPAATKTPDQTHRVCGSRADAAEQDEAGHGVALRRHIGEGGGLTFVVGSSRRAAPARTAR